MISYVRAINFQIKLMIKITLTKIYKSSFEEKQQFIQFTIVMFGNYYYILKFMLQINALIETFSNVYKKLPNFLLQINF